MRGQKRVLTS